jgi:hypothetical protein
MFAGISPKDLAFAGVMKVLVSSAALMAWAILNKFLSALINRLLKN